MLISRPLTGTWSLLEKSHTEKLDTDMNMLIIVVCVCVPARVHADTDLT